MNSTITFNIEGYEYGELKSVNATDIIDGNPVEDERFDPYDYGIDQFPNFKNVCDNFSVVMDWKVIHSEQLKNEKTFETILHFPYFSNKETFDIIVETFEKQFPLCPFNMISPIDFERLNGYGCTDFLLKFSTSFEFDVVYKEELFLPIEIENIILFNFDEPNEFNENVNIESIKDINGKTCLLEGDFHLGGMYPDIVKLMKEHNKPLKIIKNLYKEPNSLKQIVDCDNLIIQTTGFNHNGLQLLIETFKKLKFVPKRVFFVLEEIYINEPLFEKVKFYKFSTPKRIFEI